MDFLLVSSLGSNRTSTIQPCLEITSICFSLQTLEIMKKHFTLIALITLSLEVLAQNPIPSGTKFLNVGVGFSNHGVPINAGMDFGIGHNLSLGFDVTHRFDYKFENWGVAGTFNYHFNQVLNIPSNWDFYAGLNVGAAFGNGNSDVDLGAQIGGRYFFNNNTGINLQLGGGNNFSGTRVGLTFKL